MTGSLSLDSPENVLLLNPRLPASQRDLYESAWKNCIKKGEGRVGIATSGSSGELGRLIVLAKEALIASAGAVNERLDSTASDVWLKALPDFHVGGLGIRFRAQLSGANVVGSKLERWNAGEFVVEVRAVKATLLSLVPTQLFDLVRLNLAAPASLRSVVIGGGRLEESLRIEAIAQGWPVLPSYGLTECCSQVATALNPQDPRLMPLAHVRLRTNERELIKIQSPSLLSGLITLESQEAMLIDPKQDGWFTTEDRGRLCEDGSLEILGREQDFVKISGEGVSLQRLEDLFDRLRRRFHAESDLALLAARDERSGAIIVLIGNAEEEHARKLMEAFNAEVLPVARIRRFHFVDKVPRSPLGKLRRRSALALVGLEPVAHV